MVPARHYRLRRRTHHESRLKELIQPLRHQRASPFQEGFVTTDIEQRCGRRDALRLKRGKPGFLDHSREVDARRLVADLPVGLTSDEGHIRDVIGFAGRIAALQNSLWEDVVELEAMVRTLVIERNGIRLFHSGDTLWHDGLIPALLPLKCDLMLLPINGNKPERRVAGNLNGTEAAALAKACGAGLVVQIGRAS